jgi:hypothetical protein
MRTIMSNEANSETATPTGASSTMAPSSRGGLHIGRRSLTISLVVVLLIVAILVGVLIGHHNKSSNATINVTGSGTVQGTPDTVNFQIGVSNTASSAVQALNANNQQIASLEAALAQHGVTKADMQTSGLAIYDNTNMAGVITGFTVSNSLSVTMHNLKDAGAAIDAGAQVAGNNVQLSGITFSISNDSKLLAAARAKAMKNAHTEASDVAKGANVSVGHVLKVTDQENTSSPNIIYPGVQSFASAARSVPIEAGTQSINVQVTVTYALAS